MPERIRELALDASILAFAVGGILFVNPTGAEVAEGPGGLSWRTLPMVYAILLLALAAFSIGVTLLSRAPGGAPKPAGGAGGTGHGMRRFGVVVALVLYSQGLVYFGFALSTPVFLLALLFLFGRAALAENIAVSLVGAAVLWLLFAYLLRMPLTGRLWDPVTPALLGAIRSIGG